MSKKTRKGAPTPQVDHELWKKMFLLTLDEAPNAPTSEGLANATTRALKAMGEKRTVSRALVEKWRSKLSPMVPANPSVSSALLEALDQLGVLDLLGKAEAAERSQQLLQLLGHAGQPSLRGRLRRVLREVLEDLFEPTVGGALPPPPSMPTAEAITASACLLSQRAVHAAGESLVKDGPGGHVLSLVQWDPTSDSASTSDRTDLAKELTSKATTDYFAQFRTARVQTHVVLKIVSTRSRTRAFESEIDDLYDLLQSSRPLTGRPSVRLWTLDDEAQRPRLGADGYWIHLHKDGRTAAAWRLVRHSDLYVSTKSSPASTFCSPLRPTDCDELISELSISSSAKDAWLVNPGEPWKTKTERANG